MFKLEKAGQFTHGLKCLSDDDFSSIRKRTDSTDPSYEYFLRGAYREYIEPSGSFAYDEGDDFHDFSGQHGRTQSWHHWPPYRVSAGSLLILTSTNWWEEGTERKVARLDKYGQRALLHYLLGKHEGLESTRQDEKEGWIRELVSLESQEEVLEILEEAGLSKEVEQLRRYLADREKELEEGEYPGIRLDSLKAVSRFLISHDNLPFSAIRADFDGYADLEWFLSSRRGEGDDDDMFWGEGDGQFVLRFVTPNLIEFAMLSGPWIGEAERLSLSGTMSHSKLRIILDLFHGRMVPYGEG